MSASITIEPSVLTRDEANQRLPLVQKIAGDLVESWDEILKKRRFLEELNEQGADELVEFADESAGDLQASLERLVDRINQCVREIGALGGAVYEFRRGVVGFPSVIDGQAVTLSWMHGEESFSHYHLPHQTPHWRRPLPE